MRAAPFKGDLISDYFLFLTVYPKNLVVSPIGLILSVFPEMHDLTSLRKFNLCDDNGVNKGRLISECNFDVLKYSKKPTKF